MLKTLAIVGAVAGLAVVGRGVAASSAPPAAHSQVDTRIERVALRFARQMGERAPREIAWVASRHLPAERVASGDIDDTNQLVYLVALRGHFVANDVPIPPGASPPRGTVLTLILTRSRLRVLDLGVGDKWPHLARLGPVHVLS